MKPQNVLINLYLLGEWNSSDSPVGGCDDSQQRHLADSVDGSPRSEVNERLILHPGSSGPPLCGQKHERDSIYDIKFALHMGQLDNTLLFN